MSDDTNLRDTFAAAALTGLIANGDYSVESTPLLAYRMADAMLRERTRNGALSGCETVQSDHIADASKMVDLPSETGPDPDSRIWETHPASTPQVPRKPDTDRLAEWERLGSHRWGLGVASDLYDLECRVAVLEKANLDAAPAAKAPEPDHMRAGPPHPADGTGDTPLAAGGRVACGLGKRQPLDSPSLSCAESPVTDGRPAPTAERTPAPHATPSEGTEQSECRFRDSRNADGPVAWGIECDGELLAAYTCEDEESAVAMVERFAETGMTGHAIVPLYRAPKAAWQLVHDNERLRDEVMLLKAKPPTLDAEEVELLREFRDETAQYADEIGLSSSEVRERHMLIDRLLARAAGER